MAAEKPILLLEREIGWFELRPKILNGGNIKRWKLKCGMYEMGVFNVMIKSIHFIEQFRRALFLGRQLIFTVLIQK